MRYTYTETRTVTRDWRWSLTFLAVFVAVLGVLIAHHSGVVKPAIWSLLVFVQAWDTLSIFRKAQKAP